MPLSRATVAPVDVRSGVDYEGMTSDTTSLNPVTSTVPCQPATLSWLVKQEWIDNMIPASITPKKLGVLETGQTTD